MSTSIALLDPGARRSCFVQQVLLSQECLVPMLAGVTPFSGLDGAIVDCIVEHYARFIADWEAKAQASALEDLRSRTHFVTFGHQNSHSLRSDMPFDLPDNV